MAIEQVEPAKCTLWQFHERFGDDPSDESCKELIASIARHGQRHPVLGRKIARTPGAKIELIYGARRLFAAARLGVQLLVDVRDLDDHEAVVEMEIENRLRTDVSPYERGMSYRRWLNAGLFTSQSELAKELGVSEAQVSRLLRYAELPAAVVGAFDSVRSIREEWAVALAKMCQDSSLRQGILRRAREASQDERRHPPEAIFRRLMTRAHSSGREGTRPRDEVVKTLSGKTMYRIAVRAKTIHFIVSRNNLSDFLLREMKSQLASALGPMLEDKASAHVSFSDRTNHSTPSALAGA